MNIIVAVFSIGSKKKNLTKNFKKWLIYEGGPISKYLAYKIKNEDFGKVAIYFST